jgi:hypothetical protein
VADGGRPKIQNLISKEIPKFKLQSVTPGVFPSPVRGDIFVATIPRYYFQAPSGSGIFG